MEYFYGQHFTTWLDPQKVHCICFFFYDVSSVKYFETHRDDKKVHCLCDFTISKRIPRMLTFYMILPSACRFCLSC